MNSTTVAQTILNQLGGNKFIAMTGVKNLLSDESKLHMKLAKNMSNANYLTIELNSMDTYNIRFFKQTGGKMNMKTFEITPVKQKDIKVINDIYCDQLQGIFTQVTGMYISL